jgi:hypothetical protein
VSKAAGDPDARASTYPPCTVARIVAAISSPSSSGPNCPCSLPSSTIPASRSRIASSVSSTGSRSSALAITSGSIVNRPIGHPRSTSRSRRRYASIRSYGVPGPSSTPSAVARNSSAVRRIAASASSGLPLKWWYMLPCPAPARSRIALGLVPT